MLGVKVQLDWPDTSVPAVHVTALPDGLVTAKVTDPPFGEPLVGVMTVAVKLVGLPTVGVDNVDTDVVVALRLVTVAVAGVADEEEKPVAPG